MAMLFLFSLKPFLNLVLMWHCMYSNIAETETYAVRMDCIMMWECDNYFYLTFIYRHGKWRHSLSLC